MKIRRFISYVLIVSMINSTLYLNIVLASTNNDPTQDSNATSYTSPLEVKVDPRTGQLQTSIKAPALSGFFGEAITPSISYSQTSVTSGHQMLGLPLGWEYNYSYIYEGYVFINGKASYMIDREYSSGLRYVTMNTMSFAANTLTFLNGDRYTFDDGGKLTQMKDRFGNAVQFNYNGTGDIYNSNLSTIIDSFGQKTVFNYQNGVTITYPNGGQNQIAISYIQDNNLRLVRYKNPIGLDTNFTNEGGIYGNLISKITYPNGKTISCTYGTLPYLTDSSKENIAYLDSVSTYVESANGSVKTTSYNYNAKGTLNNYTGYGEYTMYGSDGLLESDDSNYFYYTAVNDGVFVTQHKYNHLHLEVETGVWTKPSYYVANNSRPNVSLTLNMYPGQDSNGIFTSWKYLKSRFPNYQTPVQVTAYTYNDQGQKREHTVKTQFDNYANPVKIETYESGTPTSTVNLINKKLTSYDYGHYGLVTQETAYDYAQSQTAPIITQSNSVISTAVGSFGKAIGQTKTGFVINGVFQPSKMSTFTYDSAGRQISQTLAWADGAQHRGPANTAKTKAYAYDANAHTLTITDADCNGNQTVTVIDAITGFKKSVTNALGASVRYMYDNLGRKLMATDPLGVVTLYAYSTSPSLNKVTTRQANGYENYVYYDGFNRKIKTSDNLGGHERTLSLITYDALTQQVGTEKGILGDNSLISYSYDVRGQLASKKDALGNITSYTYDPVAQTTTTFFNGVKTTMEQKGDLQSVNTAYSATSNDSYSTLKRYDGSNKEVYKLVGNRSSNFWIEEISTYDSEHALLTKTVNGSDHITITQNITRDLFGNAIITTNTLAVSGVVNSTSTSDSDIYNALNQLTSETNTLNQSSIFTYDAIGRKITQRDYAGTTFTSAYNKNNQVTSTSYTNNQTLFTYDTNTYDLISTEKRVNNVSQGTMRRTYDLAGNLESITYPDGKIIQNAYDTNKNQLTTFTDVMGVATSYGYDVYGRLSSLTTSVANDTVNYAYFSKAESVANSGLLKSITYGNGLVKSFTYDGYGDIQMVTMTDNNAASNLNQLMKATYTYDPITRNVTSITYSSTASPADTKLNYSTVYTYNTMNQLIQEVLTTTTTNARKTTVYSYDAASNIKNKSITDTNSTVTTNTYYTYDSDNKLTTIQDQDGTRTMTYDTNGNLLNDGQGSAYTYNELDQLISFANGGNTFQYGYYPNGLRANKQTSGKNDVIQFYYDDAENANIVNEIQGTKAASYLTQGSGRYVRYVKDSTNNQTAVQYLMENKKDTLGVLDVSKKFTGTYQYNPYGGSGAGFNLTLNISDNPFRYTKEYTDLESGLVYLRARYYNSAIERFTTRDSYPLFNRYNYASGNPIMFIDPSGHASIAANNNGHWTKNDTAILMVVLSVALCAATFGAAAPAAGTLLTAGLTAEAIGGGLAVASSVAGTIGAVVDADNTIEHDGSNKDETIVATTFNVTSIALGVGSAGCTYSAGKMSNLELGLNMLSATSQAGATTTDTVNKLAYNGNNEDLEKATLGLNIIGLASGIGGLAAGKYNKAQVANAAKKAAAEEKAAKLAAKSAAIRSQRSDRMQDVIARRTAAQERAFQQEEVFNGEIGRLNLIEASPSRTPRIRENPYYLGRIDNTIFS